MRVQIDEAGHDVHPLGVDLARGVLRPTFVVDRRAWRPDAAHLGDPVPLDDEIYWALRRTAGAVDHDRTADDQPLERSLALVAPVGRRNHLAGILRRRGGADGQTDDHRARDKPPVRVHDLSSN